MTAFLAVLVALFVDLKPHVDEEFFFSSNDPQFRQSHKINEMFPAGDQLILAVAATNIASESYLQRLEQLTQAISSVKQVIGVRSLANGPKNFEDAEKSPLWRRLLIAENGKSSNVVVSVQNNSGEQLMRQIERIAQKFETKNFAIRIAGAPYVADMIRRNLQHDFVYFSLTAFLLFGVAMGLVFRSVRLVSGMLATCTSASLVTLFVQSLFGEKVGILTANLVVIVFVVALSHLVYMTFNWQTLAKGHDGSSGDLGTKARRMTFPASFWSMVCSSLGFASLLIVPAKPLRELGVGGVLGTVLALICAYIMYPAFLSWADVTKTREVAKGLGSKFWEERFVWTSAVVVLASIGLSFGLTRLNTDPSLLDYFKKGSEVRQGLEYVDRNGGSNPLTLVIAARNGEKLDAHGEYERLWGLQNALQQYKGVGTVLSLPVLLAEAKDHPLAFLLSSEHLLKILEEPKHGRITGTFVTKDRRDTALYLRMEEQKRSKPRLAVVHDLEEIVQRHGFRVALTGGIYVLEGALAKLVASSLIKGLFWLILFFIGIAAIVARSVRGAAAMILSLCLVPACTLGWVGLFHVPVDIISAPATNVCIGMAIDSMVHLMFAVRRANRDGKQGWDAWVAARQEQWRGIIFSDVIIAAGFGIFMLSSFPPTQRFGTVVVSGTVIDILANLFVLPLLGGAQFGGRALPRIPISATSKQ